jgi:hypothetical protein
LTDAEKIMRLTNALSWALCELYGLKHYMARPENGDYGVECAVCRSEWFADEDLIEMDNARQVLIAAGGTLQSHAKA